MAAAEIALEIASPLHGRTENVLDNVRANDRTIAGQPAAFSSFALSSMSFPVLGVSSWSALAAYKEVFDVSFFNLKQSSDEISADVLAFTQKAGVEEEVADQILERLGTYQNERIKLPLLIHDFVQGIGEEQLLGTLQRMEDAALEEIEKCRDKVSENTPKITSLFTNELNQEITTALTDSDRGPQYLVWFLNKLQTRMQSQRDNDLTNSQAASGADKETYKEIWKSSYDTLTKALRLPRWLPTRKHQIEMARDAYINGVNTYIKAIYEHHLVSEATECINNCLAVAKTLSQAAGDFLDAWQQISEMCKSRSTNDFLQRKAGKTDYSLMYSIVTQEDMKNLFEEMKPNLLKEASTNGLVRQFWNFFFARCPNWNLDKNAKISSRETPPILFYEFLATWFMHRIQAETLIERLQCFFPDTWRQEIGLRYRQTSPFWNYNLSRFGDRIRNNLQDEPRLVGYGEDNVDYWNKLISDITGEPTNGVRNKNTQEIVFLNTSHGLPLFALRSMNTTLHTAYEYLSKLWAEEKWGNPIPVHASSKWETDLMQIQPQIDKAGKVEEI